MAVWAVYVGVWAASARGVRACSYAIGCASQLRICRVQSAQRGGALKARQRWIIVPKLEGATCISVGSSGISGAVVGCDA